ncbi:MAG: HAD-IIIA family hydrolase [Deltaproteobacteria bacterium]|nr:HAD-IIIA family hydrolase [Deltaproteobacteria bacterium]
MKAVILAGGRGTRLAPLTDKIPKPMLPVGGKPILQHQIECLQRYGVNEVFLTVGYGADAIRDFFGNGEKCAIKIHYVQEEIPLGTAGGLKELEGRIAEDFFLIYGDLLFDVHLPDFYAFHLQKKGIATLFVHPNDHPRDSDLLAIDIDRQLTAIFAKPHGRAYLPNLSNGALYVLSPDIFQYLPASRKVDFMHDIFPELLRGGQRLYAYKSAEYVKDMGTRERLAKVNRDYDSGKPARLSKRAGRPAVFLDRDGTLIEEVDLLHKAEDLCLFPFAAEAVKKINESGLLAILVTNQSVIARNLCSTEQLQVIHNKMESLLAAEQGAFLDDILYCPHHPHGGFPEENPAYKRQCSCRKPAIGLIEKAVALYNIDLSSSWMIGDTTVDIQTGKNAGLRTILVQTGQRGQDKRYAVEPDFVFKNLLSSAEYIYNEQELAK